MRQEKYLQEQITQFQQYRNWVKDSHMKARKGRKNKVPGKLLGPFKFSYLDLVKKGVILDSDVPKIA